ncbi:MAG TPA: flagellar hook protein FlgE [Burkholderiaceae bacterium]|jgi:flagellar hook protein FlgE
MGFEQGLSGLEASTQNLAVIGNNVANSSTVGFKSSEVLFADVYANSLTGAGASQVGIGVQVQSVEQQFTQGNITSSNNPLDIAINGGGFYQMSNHGTISYTRNGQFQIDKTGYIVNATGDRLQGYAANASGTLQTGSTTDLQINTANIAPSATGSIKAVLNLDSKDAIPTTTPFNATDPTTYNNSSSITIYDSLGDSHVLQSYYVKTGPTAAAPAGTEGTWAVYATLDNTEVSGTVPPTPIGNLAFTTAGAVDTTATTLPFVLNNLNVTTGAISPLGSNTPAGGVTLDFTGATQYGAAFATTALTQDGFTSGQLSGFSASADGTIVGSYTNGQSKTLGQIALASFTDPNGLQNLGNNQWAATATSGTPLVGVPGTGTLGVLQSSATENSNVDLTSQLVNMITAQEDYQANAQTIKTENELLQVLVTLR